MLTRVESDANALANANALAQGELDVPALRIEPTDAVRLVALIEGSTCSLAELRHALHAHRLAGAESFAELLSLSRLLGVERHGYQTETVHRVLRTLRGRADARSQFV